MRNKKNYKFTTMNRKIAAISNYDDFLIETKRKESKAVRNKDYFKKVKPYNETVIWENGEDVCPEDLYYNSIEIKKSNNKKYE